MPIDRSSKTDVRQRRAFQGLAGGYGFTFLGGITFDADSGEVSIDLKDVDPGLVLLSDGLAVLLSTVPDPGLSLTGGLHVLLAGTPGLSVGAGGLTVDLRNGEPGLELTATGVGVLLAADPGLEYSTGVRVKLDGASLTRAAAGLSVTAPEGRYTVTAVKTANYNAAIGELVRCNPTGGAFAVNLPASAAANAGRSIVVKNTTASANAITITPSGAETIDGAATLVIAAGRGRATLVDPGTGGGAGDWMIVA